MNGFAIFIEQAMSVRGTATTLSPDWYARLNGTYPTIPGVLSLNSHVIDSSIDPV